MTKPEQDNPPVQCWHTEPDSPCDWDVCRQPERLAAGDRGTDPAQQTREPATGVGAQPPIRCNWAQTRWPHRPHTWEPQPGMDPIPCPGYTKE